tara:strand:+ start:1652 stop:2287 length:636 start_codon:yes stop_codon:yes gene_type:complete
MKISAQQLRQIIKEELETTLDELDEATRRTFLKLLGMGAGVGAAYAAGIQPAAAKGSASLSDLARKLVSFIGKTRHDNWLNPKHWKPEDINSEPLVAFVEVMQAVKSHWTSTVPNQYMGCGSGEKTKQCDILRKIAIAVKDEVVPIIKSVTKMQGRRLNRAKEKKLTSLCVRILDRWVPADTRANSIFETKIWKDFGGGTSQMAMGDYDED